MSLSITKYKNKVTIFLLTVTIVNKKIVEKKRIYEYELCYYD